MSKNQNIENQATHIVGEHRLQRIREMRKEKNIASEAVRRVFMPIVKLTISEMTPETLGRICASAGNINRFGPEYENQFLVTDGTNAWSAVFVSTEDSGEVVLQKVAAAGLLSMIYELINRDQPQREASWMPFQVKNRADFMDSVEGFAVGCLSW